MVRDFFISFFSKVFASHREICYNSSIKTTGMKKGDLMDIDEITRELKNHRTILTELKESL